jgi:AcrR family transcriptional regulator
MASTLEDRAAARRAALIEAGVELLGTVGAVGVTVRAVCRGAKLTERYFYESFDSRDALLRAVHAQVAGEARDAIVAAVAAAPADDPERVAHSAVAAFTAFLLADPRRGRVLLSESFTDSVLSQHDLELVPAFAALFVTQLRALPDPPDDVDAQLTAVALLGALRTLYLTWLGGDPPVAPERLNAHATALIVAASSVRSAST